MEVDASQKAIGMALIQTVQNEHESKAIDGQHQNWVEASVNDWEKSIIPNDLLPVAYGSKTLTDAEGQYASIECELLGVAARIEKFQTFCYGSSTIILSDHKPLMSIVRKDLVNAPPRLQRLLSQLQKYNVTTWYKPGKSMIFADHLSHNIHPEASNVPMIPDLNLEVSALELNASPSKLECIAQEAEHDPQMLMLKELIIQGWPKEIKQCPLPIRAFWNFRDELSIIDGIVVKGSHIVIPTKFQPELLSLLHDGSHLGIDKCVQCAKGSIYWPSITEDIKSIINKCEKCLANCRDNQKELYIPIDIPIVAWKTIATDLFVFQDKIYILIIDLFSHFAVVRQLSGENTRTVSKAMQDIFVDFGIPGAITSDNGPCHKSQEFRDFCARFEINHITGASYNHQANSIAERMIQTIKQLMVKNQNDTWLAMLILKSMPMNGIDRSLAELLCNRHFGTNIPMIQHASNLLYKARFLNEDLTKYQTGSKELVPLSLGRHVLYDKNPDNSTKIPQWSKGGIKDTKEPGCKYTIESDAGKNITKTRQDIRPDGTYVTNSGRVSRPPERLIAKM